uniref:Helicase ATP-binding domain-containing protein n=1 Tax=viral metagenome TaxID=1070528 RepID=A0A6C0HA75_9ZZZZ
MNNSKGYIYVRSHYSYDVHNAYKIGITNNIPDRDKQYATGEIKRGYFEAVYEVSINIMEIIERLLQYEFRDLNIKYDAGIEFYNKKIITLIDPYLIKLGLNYRKLSKNEIDDLVRCNRVRITFNKINIQSLIKTLKSITINKKYIWNERDYQTSIINFSKTELNLNNKIYIELPTGGGKSYIVYNLFEYLKSDFIIIVSPRKIVNSQNISYKYLQILNDKYITFNYSTDNNFNEYLSLSNKKIIICCTQSIDKIYNKILSKHITNITVWFDEAHWGIEEWIETLHNNIYSRFWLSNNILIKYRIFTSASPNKSKILENKNIFGKLYSPIKVKELIQLKWLSGIQSYVYSENKKNVDNIKYIINDFHDKNRKFGFSFHNKQINAFNLFYKHYLQYKNNQTYIKPFLLVSNNFTIEKEPKLQEIILEYDYRDIKIYEITIHSIGYVVAKYSMGYDFNKLDFICLSDPKVSIQDIKQCIGRGIRPDELGQYGSNKEKILIVSLPVYIDDNGDNKYEKILEVLKYLIYDIEISLDEIEFINRYIPNNKEVNYNYIKYDGINDVKSILLNLLELENKKNRLQITYEKAKKIIANKNLKSKESYYELCDKDNRLSKEPEIIFKKQFTNWVEYLNIKRVYYDFQTCKNKINKYLLLYPNLKKYLELSAICNELCKIDILFPPNGLWTDYYNVNNLRDIIIISNKKKITI